MALAFPFFQLPLELRQKVYEHHYSEYVDSREPYASVSVSQKNLKAVRDFICFDLRRSQRPEDLLNLWLVSKTVYDESTDVAFRRLAFSFWRHDYEITAKSLMTLGYLDKLRYIYLRPYQLDGVAHGEGSLPANLVFLGCEFSPEFQLEPETMDEEKAKMARYTRVWKFLHDRHPFALRCICSFIFYRTTDQEDELWDDGRAVHFILTSKNGQVDREYYVPENDVLNLTSAKNDAAHMLPIVQYFKLPALWFEEESDDSEMEF